MIDCSGASPLLSSIISLFGVLEESRIDSSGFVFPYYTTMLAIVSLSNEVPW